LPFATIPRPALFAFLPVFNMFLEELTPCLTIRSAHDSFLLGIVFKESIMTYIQPLVKVQFIERLQNFA
jgi:hypothetical protein